MVIIRLSGELKVIPEEMIYLSNLNILKKNQTFYGNRMKIKIMTIFIIFNANIIASLKNKLNYLKELGI